MKTCAWMLVLFQIFNLSGFCCCIFEAPKQQETAARHACCTSANIDQGPVLSTASSCDCDGLSQNTIMIPERTAQTDDLRFIRPAGETPTYSLHLNVPSIHLIAEELLDVPPPDRRRIERIKRAVFRI